MAIWVQLLPAMMRDVSGGVVVQNRFVGKLASYLEDLQCTPQCYTADPECCDSNQVCQSFEEL